MDSYALVRQAYRYLHDFHTRLRSCQFQLIRQIDKELEFSKSKTMFTYKPSFGAAIQANWTSDYFPLINLVLVFARQDKAVRLELMTVIDTEVFEKGGNIGRASQNPENTHSKIYLAAYPESRAKDFKSNYYFTKKFDLALQDHSQIIGGFVKMWDISAFENVAEMSASIEKDYSSLIS